MAGLLGVCGRLGWTAIQCLRHLVPFVAAVIALVMHSAKSADCQDMLAESEWVTSDVSRPRAGHLRGARKGFR